ncbi:MAG: hypothetical protein ABIV51_07400 [Saprospiraceae bacterium]
MNKVLVFLLMLGFLPGIYAQERPMENRVEAQRVAFITQRLDLSPAEAQKFWPVYNEFKGKMKEMKKDKRDFKPVDEMSEQEAENFIRADIDTEERELQLRKLYTGKFREVLSARKVAILSVSERQFREKLLQQVADRRQNSGGKPTRKH